MVFLKISADRVNVAFLLAWPIVEGKIFIIMVELQHLQYGKLLKHMTFSAAIPLVMFNARLQGLHCSR